MSLRETDQIKRFTQGLGTSKTAMTNKIKEGIETLKTKFRGSGKAADEVQDIVDQKIWYQVILMTWLQKQQQI